MFYVFGEDMAPGMVGPFETRESAEAHIEYQRERGDAAVCVHFNTRVVTTQQIQQETKLLWTYNNNRTTPELDRRLYH